MVWQDIVLATANVLFGYALIPRFTRVSKTEKVT